MCPKVCHYQTCKKPHVALHRVQHDLVSQVTDSFGEGSGYVGGRRGDCKKLEPVAHLVWAGQHLVAGDQVLCL